MKLLKLTNFKIVLSIAIILLFITQPLATSSSAGSDLDGFQIQNNEAEEQNIQTDDEPTLNQESSSSEDTIVSDAMQTQQNQQPDDLQFQAIPDAEDEFTLHKHKSRIALEGYSHENNRQNQIEVNNKNNVIYAQLGGSIIKLRSLKSANDMTTQWRTTFDVGESTLTDMKIDAENNIIIVGYTENSNFNPTLNEGQYMGEQDGFILKFSSTGALLFARYLGGSYYDSIQAVAADKFNNIYLTGDTYSADLSGPQINSYTANADGFVSKLTPSGSLFWTRFIGGSSGEAFMDIDTSTDGEISMIGVTSSADIPLVNPINSTLQDTDILISTVDDQGSLQFSTYISAESSEHGYGIRYDSDNNLVAVGLTQSDDFMLKDPLDTTRDGDEIVLFSFNTINYEILFSTYFGGYQSEYVISFELDHFDNILLGFNSYSSDLTKIEQLTDGYHKIRPIFLGKISSDGSQILWSTRLYTELYPSPSHYTKPLYCVNNKAEKCWDYPGSSEWNHDIAFDKSGNILNSGFFRIQQINKWITTETKKVCKSWADWYFFCLSYKKVTKKYPHFYYKTLYRARINIIAELSPPSEPRSVAAVGQDNQVKLSWLPPEASGNSNLKEYLVYRAYSSSGPYEKIATTSKSSYLDTFNVTNGLSYYYKITASNYNGESKYSEEVSARAVGTPTPPSNLVAEQGNSSVNLKWTEPFNNGGFPLETFTIYRGTSSGFYQKIGTTDNVEDLSYNDTSAQNGYKYYYVVTANNSLGESEQSVETQITLADTPSGPNLVSAIPGSNEVQLSWEEPERLGGKQFEEYRVYRRTLDTNKYTFLTSTTGQSFTDTTVTNGIEYAYVVTAVNSLASGVYSNELRAIPADAPSSPQDTSARSTSNEIELTWFEPLYTHGAEITHYNIYRTDDLGNNMVFLTKTTATSFVDTAVTAGSDYYYKIIAVNKAGESMSGSILTGRLETHVSNPKNLELSSGEDQINLQWQSPEFGADEVLFYKIYRKKANQGFFNLLTYTTAQTFNDTSVTNGVKYQYKVSAYHDEDTGDSNVMDAVSSGPPGRGRTKNVVRAPYTLRVLPQENQLLLLWKQVKNAKAYNIYRSSASSGPYSLLGSTSDLQFEDTSISTDTIYYYVITSIDRNDVESLYSNEMAGNIQSIPNDLTNIKATGSDNLVQVSWTDPVPGEQGLYIIERRHNNGNYSIIGSTVYPSYNDDNVVNGEQYSYRVRKGVGVNTGNVSSSVTVTPVGSPDAPQRLSLTLQGPSATLSWSEPNRDGGSEISHYNIYRWTRITGYTLVGQTTDLTYTDETNELNQTITAYDADDKGINSTEIFYKVTAVNNASESRGSNEDSAIPAWLLDFYESQIEENPYPQLIITLSVIGIIVLIRRRKQHL